MNIPPSWSLLEMIRYAIRDLHALLLWIDHMSNYTMGHEKYRTGDAANIDDSEVKWIAPQVTCIRKHLEWLEVKDGLSICDEFKIKLEHPHEKTTLGECRGVLLCLRRMLTDALDARVFMYVPQKVARYARHSKTPTTQLPHLMFSLSLIENSPATRPLGDAVFEKFKKARFDAEQFALCMLAGASTAAVFHLMRVVEWGVRLLGSELGLKKIKEVLKPKQCPSCKQPMGKLKAPLTRLTPIENATWEKLNTQLRAKIEKKIGNLRPGPVKDMKLAYYNGILQDFHGFKDAWRNHVMHTRLECDEKIAERVLLHVESFMQSLASPPWGKQPLPKFYGK